MFHVITNASDFGGAEIFICELVDHFSEVCVWTCREILEKLRVKTSSKNMRKIKWQEIDFSNLDDTRLTDLLSSFSNKDDQVFLNVQWPQSYEKIFTLLHLVVAKVHIHLHLFPYGRFPSIKGKDVTISCVSKDISDRLYNQTGSKSVVTGNQPVGGVEKYLSIDVADTLNTKALIIGRVDSQKNFDEAIFYSSLLKSSGLVSEVAWAGWNESVLHYKSPNIDFLGVQIIPEIITDYGFIIFFSKYEGLSLSLLEAMAAGRVVFAPKESSFPEVIRNNENGFLFNLNVVSSLLKKLEMVSDIKERLRISREARSSVVNYCKKYKVFEILKREVGYVEQ